MLSLRARRGGTFTAGARRWPNESLQPTGDLRKRFHRRLEDRRGWRLEVARHPERQLWRYGLKEKPAHTFRVLPRRRVVERTMAWLGQSRRLSRDYERLPVVADAMIYGALSRLMLGRLPHSAAKRRATPGWKAATLACRIRDA